MKSSVSLEDINTGWPRQEISSKVLEVLFRFYWLSYFGLIPKYESEGRPFEKRGLGFYAIIAVLAGCCSFLNHIF